MKRKILSMLVLLLSVMGAVRANVDLQKMLPLANSSTSNVSSAVQAIMQGWQNVIVFESAEGVDMDENSGVDFVTSEEVNSNARVTLHFDDGTNVQCYYLIGYKSSAEDTSIHWGKGVGAKGYFNNIKKMMGDDEWAKHGSKKLVKVTLDNFNTSEDTTYNLLGGTVCGQPMQFKKSNAKVFSPLSAVCTANGQYNQAFKYLNLDMEGYTRITVNFGEPAPAGWTLFYNDGSDHWKGINEGDNSISIDVNVATLDEINVYSSLDNSDGNYPISINISSLMLSRDLSSLLPQLCTKGEPVYYRLKNAKYGFYAQYKGANALMGLTSDQAEASVFYFVDNGGNFNDDPLKPKVKIYSLNSGDNFIYSQNEWKTTDRNWYLNGVTINGYNGFQMTFDGKFPDALRVGGSGSTEVKYQGGTCAEYEGSVWNVELVEYDPNKALTTITWTVKDALNNTVKTETRTNCVEGEDYTTTITGPFVTLSGSTTVTANTEDQNVELTYSIDGNAPFQYSSDFASASWYTASIRGYYLSWSAADDKFVCPHTESNKTAPASPAKKDIFAFVGNPWSLKIINAALGEDKAIKGDTPKGVDFAEAQEYVFENNNGHYVFRAAETTNKRLNDVSNSGTLGYWDNGGSAQDGGSSFTFDEIDPSLVEDIMNAVEPEPEPWVCPDDETDITTLPWVKKDQDCVQDFGVGKGNIFGTDAGEGNISYVDITDYETIKVYGAPGSVVRAFINREEAATDGKDFIFVFDAIGNDGVATVDLYKVAERLGDYGHLYLNGIKAGPNHDSKATVYGITLVEKPAPYTISTTAGKVGTIALDYPATIEGATLYEVVGFNTTDGLALAEVEGDMVGGTPYIYQASADEVVCTKNGASVAHGDFDCTKSSVGNGLVGCYSQVKFNETSWFGFIKGSYIISGGMLYKISNGQVTIPANRCFFDSSKCKNNNQTSVKMQLGFAEDATAIQNVNEALNGGKIYDLNGREVKTMKKGGIYIMGGMKVSIK